MSEDLQKVRELIVKLFVRRVFQEERTVEQGDHCGWNRMRKKTVDQVMEVRAGGTMGLVLLEEEEERIEPFLSFSVSAPQEGNHLQTRK